MWRCDSASRNILAANNLQSASGPRIRYHALSFMIFYIWGKMVLRVFVFTLSEGKTMPLTVERRRGLILVLALVCFGLVISLISGITNFDMSSSSRFYSNDSGAGHWPVGKSFPFSFLYRYGEIPGLALGIFALGGYVLTRLRRISKRYSSAFLVMVFTVILGPGLAVNGILKEHWGRPRPADIIEFGGSESYRDFWRPGGTGSGKSFVCGHCAIAFSTCSIVALYPIHPVLASVGLGAGLIFGGLVSLARVAQGGHFPTDIVWSAVIVWSTITLLYYFVFRVPERCDS